MLTVWSIPVPVIFWYTNTSLLFLYCCPHSKLLNFITFLFSVIAIAAISSGPGQEEGDAPYATFPSNNTFFYDVPQEEVSPMCNVNFGNNNGSNATSSLTSPVKYLADYNFLSESRFDLFVVCTMQYCF